MLIISTLLCPISMAILYLLPISLTIPAQNIMLACLSAVPMVTVWAGYFYLLQLFSTHHVVALFGLSSLWLLCFELLGGDAVSAKELAGIGILILGAYIIDRGTFKWGIPSRLLLFMLPVSAAWAVTLYMVKLAIPPGDTGATAVYFWQLLGIVIIGLDLFALVRPYRRGFIMRIRTERRRFILPSFFNEGAAQLSNLCTVLAVAAAPLATYVSAVGGIQSIFLILLFWFFPLDHRNATLPAQWLGVMFIAAGIALLELPES